MKVLVDKNTCIGCGLCASMFEEIFAMNDSGVSEPITELVASELEENAEEACSCCPVDAITTEN